MRFRVVITWPCRSTVEIDASSREQAEAMAFERGLPWDDAIEDDDGGSTMAVAHLPDCQSLVRPLDSCDCDAKQQRRTDDDQNHA